MICKPSHPFSASCENISLTGNSKPFSLSPTFLTRSVDWKGPLFRYLSGLALTNSTLISWFVGFGQLATLFGTIVMSSFPASAMHRGVTRLDGARGARNKFGTPMFTPEVFRKQIYCNEESTWDIVETFRGLPQWFGAPIVIRRPGNFAPLSSLVTSLAMHMLYFYSSLFLIWPGFVFSSTSGIYLLVLALPTSCISFGEVTSEEMFTNFKMAPSFFSSLLPQLFSFFSKNIHFLSLASFAGWNAS